MSHTPGPWGVLSIPDSKSLGIHGPEGELSRIATIFLGDRQREVDKANARLISAAPELLEALIALREAGARGSAEFDAAVPRAEAAIHKATGEQP